MPEADARVLLRLDCAPEKIHIEFLYPYPYDSDNIVDFEIFLRKHKNSITQIIKDQLPNLLDFNHFQHLELGTQSQFSRLTEENVPPNLETLILDESYSNQSNLFIVFNQCFNLNKLEISINDMDDMDVFFIYINWGN